MTIDIYTAAERIDEATDLGATIRYGEIHVTRYGRPAGKVTQSDLDALTHSSTGWGKSLHKGAYQVWRAITRDGAEFR